MGVQHTTTALDDKVRTRLTEEWWSKQKKEIEQGKQDT